MANIKSQVKRNRQAERRRRRNQSVRSALRTAVRRFNEAVVADNVEVASTALRSACRALDKAASKGVIHRNQAANRKSGMARRVATYTGQ